jgi:hypothetical protein
MPKITIASVVEGHGETFALPVLLRRFATEFELTLPLDIPPPIRRPKDKILKRGELEKDVELASYKIEGRGAILILLDSDDDCPRDLGPQLLRRAKAVRNDIPIVVALAHREYESWFLAAGRSIAGQRGVPAQFTPPANVEQIRGAKQRISKAMLGTQVYSETVDQAALTAIMDFKEARAAKSFDRLYRKFQKLFADLTSSSASRQTS